MKRAGPPRPALFSLVRTPVPPRGSEDFTPLTGGSRNFFHLCSEPIEGVLTLLEGGHLARDSHAFEVCEAVCVGADNGHLTAEAGEPALTAQDRAKDKRIDVFGRLQIDQHPFTSTGNRRAQGLAEILGGLRVCLALPSDNTHPLPHARSVEPCVHINATFPLFRRS